MISKSKNIKQHIFEEVFSLRPKTLLDKYIDNNLEKEKNYIKFPDLFSDINELKSNQLNDQNILIEKPNVKSIIDDFSEEELFLINSYFDDSYEFLSDDSTIWNYILFNRKDKFLTFQLNDSQWGFIIFAIFIFIFFYSLHFLLAIISVFFLLYGYKSMLKIGFSPEGSVEIFLHKNNFYIQNKKTTILNILYHFVKTDNLDVEQLQILKILLFKAHKKSLEKDLIPSYYSTRNMLEDYVYTLLPYTKNMEEGNFLTVNNYITSILDDLSLND